MSDQWSALLSVLLDIQHWDTRMHMVHVRFYDAETLVWVLKHFFENINSVCTHTCG